MGIRAEFERLVPDQDARCAAIIHTAAAAAGAAAAGAIIPGSDAVLIAPIQVGMAASLANEFDIPVTDALLKSTIYASLGTMVGKGGANLMLRWVPVYGNIVRAGVAASVTEALGWTILRRLKAGEGLG